MSEAMIHDKNSGKIHFARCFWSVSKQFSRNPDKKNGANYRNRRGGRSPTKSRSKATATDNQVRIAYWRKPMSKAVIHDKNSGKIHFARCFWSVSKQFSRNPGKKNGANYRNRRGGRSPTKSRSKATATDNQVRIAYWRQPMSKAMIHDKNSG